MTLDFSITWKWNSSNVPTMTKRSMKWTQENGQGREGGNQQNRIGEVMWEKLIIFHDCVVPSPAHIVFPCTFPPSQSVQCSLASAESKHKDDLKWYQGSSDTDHSSPVTAPLISFKPKSFLTFLKLVPAIKLTCHVIYSILMMHQETDHWITSSSFSASRRYHHIFVAGLYSAFLLMGLIP